MSDTSMGYLLGIDGGGTRTTAWLADVHKGVLAGAEAGPSNPLKVGLTSAQREILRAYQMTLRRAHRRPQKLDALSAGIAGCESPDVRKPMLRWLREAIPAEACLLTTDAEVALFAALRDGPGIIVIAGTGSIALGRDKRGRRLRCGGWGNLLDDAGSGYDLGRKALNSALRAYDGRSRATSLTASLCRKLGLRKVTEAAGRDFTPQDMAALFPIVLQAASKRDRVARDLCNQAAADLADLAFTLIRRYGWKRRTARVILAGGVFKSSPIIRSRFARELHAHAPMAQVSLLQREPVDGALYLARQLVHSKETNKRKL